MRVLAAIMLLVFALPAKAEEEMRVVVGMRTFNVVSVFAPPPWTTGASIFEDTKVFKNQIKSPDGKKVFIWEAIPKDQSFENWTNLYALTAAYPIFGTLDSYFQGSVEQFTSACSDTRVEVFHKFEDTSISFVVLCGSYKNNPKTGEVGFFTMRLKDRTLVKNYYEIRVPSYVVTSSAKTPLPQAEIIEHSLRIQSLELAPPSENGQPPGSIAGTSEWFLTRPPPTETAATSKEKRPHQWRGLFLFLRR